VLIRAVASGIDSILRITAAAISMDVLEFGQLARQVRAELVERFVHISNSGSALASGLTGGACLDLVCGI